MEGGVTKTGWDFSCQMGGSKVRIMLGHHKVSGEQMQVWDLLEET